MDSLQRLARFLDRPLFPWKRLILGFSFGQFALESFFNLRQYRVLQRTKPPKVFAAEVSKEVYDKSQVGTIGTLDYIQPQANVVPSPPLGLRTRQSRILPH